MLLILWLRPAIVLGDLTAVLGPTRPQPCETSMMGEPPSLTIKTRQFQASRNRPGIQYTRALF